MRVGDNERFSRPPPSPLKPLKIRETLSLPFNYPFKDSGNHNRFVCLRNEAQQWRGKKVLNVLPLKRWPFTVFCLIQMWVCWLFFHCFFYLKENLWAIFRLSPSLWGLSSQFLSVFLIFLTLSFRHSCFPLISLCHCRCLSVPPSPPHLHPPSILPVFSWHSSETKPRIDGDMAALSVLHCQAATLRQSWQCCHGWMSTLFWHGVPRCQITNLCSFLSSLRPCRAF